MRRLITVLLIITAAQFLGGCSVLGYYSQSALGHLDVMFKSRPISEWLADDTTSDTLRNRLQQVLAMREFAITELKLPDNGSYLDYADLGRSHVVWNVFATPAFSLEPITSCFPLVGCLNYRGYFDEKDAQREAARLKALGNDVHVGGIAAYSTLGWFSDPILNTMLRWSEPRLASVLFHELAHQKLYVDDDSAFNEAFATAVGEIGVQRWYSAQQDSQTIQAWKQQVARKSDFLALVTATATRLRSLYSSDQDATAMQSAKEQIFADMQIEYAEMKQNRWQGYTGYDNWFEQVNNAKISAVSTYNRWVPAFMNILSASNHDVDAFYAECERGAKLSRDARQQWLESWLSETAAQLSSVP